MLTFLAGVLVGAVLCVMAIRGLRAIAPWFRFP